MVYEIYRIEMILTCFIQNILFILSRAALSLTVQTFPWQKSLKPLQPGVQTLLLAAVQASDFRSNLLSCVSVRVCEKRGG